MSTEYFDPTQTSVAIASQSDLNTAGSSWHWFECEGMEVSYEPVQVDSERTKQSYGAYNAPYPGRELAKLKFKTLVHGQLSDYDYTVDTPAFKGAMQLFGAVHGASNTLTYADANIDPSDGDTLTLAAATTADLPGALLCARDGSGLGARAQGFVKSVSGSGPYTVNLRQSVAIQPNADAKRLPSRTYWPKPVVPTYYTIRIVGADTTQDRRYVGCVLDQVTEERDADRVWHTYEVTAYGGEVLPDTAAGGLQPFTAIKELDPCVGQDGGARYVWSIINPASSSADPYGTEDIVVGAVTWKFKHKPIYGPARGLQGFSDVRVLAPEVSVMLSAPITSTFGDSGTPVEHVLVTYWRQRAAFGLACFHGRQEGKIYAWNMPGLVSTGRPARVTIDGVEYYQVTCRPAYYSGDTGASSTNAGNKIYGVAVA